MDPIKLLEITNPKELKKVLNKIIETYATLEELDTKFNKKQPDFAGRYLAVDAAGDIIPKAITEQAGVFGMFIVDGNLCIEQQNIDEAQFGLTEDGVLYVDIIHEGE